MISTPTKKLSSTARKAFANAGWVFFDRIFRMATALLVGVWSARYLGPSQFGLLNFASVFPTVLTSLAGLGLANVLITEIVRNKDYSENQLLGTAFVLRLIAGTVSLIAILITIQFLYSDQPVLQGMILFTSSVLVCQSVDVIDLHFQSRIKSKLSVVAKSIAFAFSTALRIYLLVNQFSLLAFSSVVFVEVSLAALILVLIYNRQEGQHMLKWRFNRQLATHLLHLSWPLMVSEFFIFIYMRCDQFMLKELATDMELGKFSAALRLSEVWYFIATAITSSFYPTIVSLKTQNEEAFQRAFRKLLSLLISISLLIAVFITFSASHLIDLLYGQQYTGADDILIIHIWSAVFVFMGVGSSYWFILHNEQRLLLIKTITGALINIVLNFVLIPRYGAIGTSFATLAAQMMTAFFMNYLIRQARPIFFAQTGAIVDMLKLTVLREWLKRTA
ncbi:PST family polysaccharide transporter [Larkinella arboricola]|uniref:PST family polysaccharide transporter n=1 Tax=Larkinella arboricola TaxID=643671 RepID=A0A327WWK5_LARAB|nr:flippase [Larkinella arboricola]RAJ97697.1 PST family polysaccharide transporter [Larkinella arboricola]